MNLFEGLHPAQVILAVEILREAERRQRATEAAPAFMHFAAFFAAMLMGRLLLKKSGIDAEALSHKNFAEALAI